MTSTPCSRRNSMLRGAGTLAALLLAPRVAVSAQAATHASATPLPHALTVRADNDAFDFWRQPWDRPDEDYTSGVRIVYDNAWKPWWSSRLWMRTPQCNGASTPCVASTSWIGQDMYTAERDTTEALKTTGARPSAGWLYYGEQFRRVGAHGADLVEVTLGVTGRSSLAQYTQKLAHALAPAFNAPIDWSHQLAFEPGVIVSYEHDELLALLSAGSMAVQLVPSATATVGNVLTRGTAKVEARVGIGLRNPWLPASGEGAPEFVVSASVAGNAVARDLFLDGSTFRRGPRVGHEPFYAERDYAISFRDRALSIGYRAVFDGRTYATGRAHPWSSFTAGWVLTH